jgi:hypothetical protein
MSSIKNDPFNLTSKDIKPITQEATVTIVAGATVNAAAVITVRDNQVGISLNQVSGSFTSSAKSNAFIPQKFRPLTRRSFVVPGTVNGTDAPINAHIDTDGTLQLQTGANAAFSTGVNGTKGNTDFTYYV